MNKRQYKKYKKKHNYFIDFSSYTLRCVSISSYLLENIKNSLFGGFYGR